jgi:hypothetical protein
MRFWRTESIRFVENEQLDLPGSDNNAVNEQIQLVDPGLAILAVRYYVAIESLVFM